MVIALTFLLRTLHNQELVAEGLRQHLNSLEQRLEDEARTLIKWSLHEQELLVDGLGQRLNSLEQRLKEEVETGGSGWLVVTESLEPCLDELDQHLDEEVEAKHREQ